MSIHNIPIVFPDKVPKGFVNDVKGFSFTQEELAENRGRLLTLDIDFGKYCRLNCPACFRRDGRLDAMEGKEMDYNDTVRILYEARALGARSVKFLGRGEPLESPRILELLDAIKSLGMTPLIFTKGHVIGDDTITKRVYSRYGISTGDGLAARLNETGASMLLSFNSFNYAVSDVLAGALRGTMPAYAEKRNRALEILAAKGFAQSNPTRLALIDTPLTKTTIAEAFEIYRFARERNMYVIATTPMISGRCRNEQFRQAITPGRDELLDLYVQVYKYNIRKGITTMDRLLAEGISSYAGATPCNQVCCGMYVTLNGTVLRCPGDDVTAFGSIWNKSLAEIWENSENRARAGTFNCHCPPKDGITIPKGFYNDVLRQLGGQA